MDDKVKVINCKKWQVISFIQEQINCLDKINSLTQQNLALKEELQAYKEDRFCQGGCTVYQYDKIKTLKEKLKVAVEENNKYQWKKCSEELPKEYTWVKINICYHREDCDVNYSQIAHFRKGVFDFQDFGVNQIIVKPNESFTLYNQKEKREITHWMLDYPPQALIKIVEME